MKIGSNHIFPRKIKYPSFPYSEICSMFKKNLRNIHYVMIIPISERLIVRILLILGTQGEDKIMIVTV